MFEVVPAVNCHHRDTDCVRGKVRKAEEFSDWIHLDVADGSFTFNKTWNDAKEWQALGSKLKLEAHLMVDDPDEMLEDWLRAGAKRVIVHAEVINPELGRAMQGVAKKYGADIMVSSNPETPVEKLLSYAPGISFFQVLAVHPGLAGQTFLPVVLGKIKFLRRELPNARIEVDGGVNLEVGKEAKTAGADILVSANYIFGSDSLREAYEALKNL